MTKIPTSIDDILDSKANEVKFGTKPEKNEESAESGIYDGNSKRFSHRELSFFDLFANVKYSFFLAFNKLIKRLDETEAHELAMNSLTRTEVLFKKGLHVFEEDICLEGILRSIHKL